MLKNSEVLFINCIGSYYYSIFQHINNFEWPDVLLYLARGKLVYKKLDMKEIYKKYSDNPWGYQPIRIETFRDQEELKIDSEFYKFVSDNCRVKTERKDIKKETDIKSIILNGLQDGKYLIVNVDEFYIPTSKKKYNKYHNKHSVMVLDVNLDDSQMKLIDSEENCPIVISLEAFKNSISHSPYDNMYLYTISTKDYVSYSIKEERLFDAINGFCNSQYLDQILRDMEDNLNRENAAYYFQGYYYNIMSKIVPYMCMVRYALLITRLCDRNVLDVLINEYCGLCNLMRLKLYKNSISYDFMRKKFYEIMTKHFRAIEELQLHPGG